MNGPKGYDYPIDMLVKADWGAVPESKETLYNPVEDGGDTLCPR